MAVRELQTDAAHVLHVERAADIDTHQLQSRFGYHPLDLEAVLSVPVESAFSTYADYGFLTILWPEISAGQSSDLRFFINRRLLVIVGDTVNHDVRELMIRLSKNESAELQQTSGAELVHEILRQLQTKVITDYANTVAAHRLTSVALATRQLGRWLNDHDQKEVVGGLVMVAHHLDVVVDRLRLAPVATNTSNTIQLPRVLRTYAVASAVMIVAVILTLSLHS